MDGGAMRTEKLILKMLTWWVVACTGIVTAMAAIEMHAGGMWFEKAGLKQAGPAMSWAWFVSIPVAAAVALIINRRVHLKPCTGVHVAALLLWFTGVVLVLVVHESGLANW